MGTVSITSCYCAIIKVFKFCFQNVMGEVRPNYKSQVIHASIIAFNRIFMTILKIQSFFSFTLKFEPAIFA
jgi:hypothetical protein